MKEKELRDLPRRYLSLKGKPRRNDDQWEKLYQFLLSCSNIYVHNEAATRRFVEALWRTTYGSGLLTFHPCAAGALKKKGALKTKR